MDENMEVLIKTKDKKEVDKITNLIKRMNTTEQNKMLIFMQGVKFAENLHTAETSRGC